jgi:hypothetical protein
MTFTQLVKNAGTQRIIEYGGQGSNQWISLKPVFTQNFQISETKSRENVGTGL